MLITEVIQTEQIHTKTEQTEVLLTGQILHTEAEILQNLIVRVQAIEAVTDLQAEVHTQGQAVVGRIIAAEIVQVQEVQVLTAAQVAKVPVLTVVQEVQVEAQIIAVQADQAAQAVDLMTAVVAQAASRVAEVAVDQVQAVQEAVLQEAVADNQKLHKPPINFGGF